MHSQQALFFLQQQQQQFQAALFQANPQMEPIPSGNLPPGFDSSSCRSVYIGNIPTNVSEVELQMMFQTFGALEGCKLIRKEKSSYGFVDYYDHRSAELAISNCNGKNINGQPLKVNWAYTSSQREDTSGHYNIFVGDLSPEITDAILFSFFSAYPTCSDAKVMWDQNTGRSRGYGFVSFRSQQDAQSAINDFSGKWLGSRQIRCNWATKGAGANDDGHNAEANSATITNGLTENGQEASIDSGPEKNPQYTTVYVGNLAPEVTQLDLHHFFHGLGAGAIEEVRIQREKGFGFVRYSEHDAAALAIQCGNNRVLCGKRVKCSWGNKPTPPGMSSSPLPPPVELAVSGPFAADLLALDHQYAFSKMGAAQGVMHPQTMAFNQAAAMGMGTGGSQAMYDAGYQSSRAQPVMYYH